MKQKLYIPTSSLNFNNIMSSESISPQSFYEMRGYGYKHFERVELNSLDNTILLYEEFPDFSIDDSELENFAILILAFNNAFYNKKKRFPKIWRTFLRRSVVFTFIV